MCQSRFIKALLALMILSLVLSACGGGQTPSISSAASSSGEAPASSLESASTTEPAPSTGVEELTLPISQEKIKITYFIGLDSKSAVTLTNYAEMLTFQELAERTNIDVEFHHPPVGQEKEQFNLLVASRDFPDIYYWNWVNDYPGGPSKAMNDGVIIPIGEYVDQYGPNLLSFFEEYPEIHVDTITDDNILYQYPFVRAEKTQRLSGGFQIRKDWLDTLGLSLPTTIDEWYTVLTAINNNDLNGNGQQDELPFISSQHGGLGHFMSAWGMAYGFYVVDGQIKYGPAEPEYKEYLTMMNKWFSEGLIDSEFLTTDTKAFNSKVTSEQAGSYWGVLNGNMGTFTGLMMETNPDFLLSEVPYPITADGKAYNYDTGASRGAPGGGLGISSANKNIKETIKWFDYHFSEEGIMLMNFGVEGTTYNMVDGEPIYTDLIMDNPEGLSINQAISKYVPASINARVFQDPRYWDQMMAYPNQREAMQILATSSVERNVPPVIATPEESERLSTIMNEIQTYRDEMMGRFIMGQEAIESFDTYIANLDSMGMQEAIAIQQGALERYYNRQP